jgi:tRNA nucleotidyltransferase (CCA-adding enzyme)
MRWLENLKGDIRPDMGILGEVQATVRQLNKCIKASKLKASCVAGGSVAKGTFLKGDFDVDLFVKFDYSYGRKNISDLLEKVIRKCFKEYDRVHGSRDYFQAHDSLNYEIVPVLDITDPKKALNVTDMSPLHVDWVKRRLKKGQEDEIRLAKYFMKANNLYGAESYVRGFSGHVLDILIIRYGDFISLLKNARAWKPKVVIDVMKHYKDDKEALDSINYSKIEGPVVVVDPVYPARNAASAVSMEKFTLLKKKAADFLEKPSPDFFVRKEITPELLKRKSRGCALVVLMASPREGKDDVAGAGLLKAFGHIRDSLKESGFTLKDSGWDWARGRDSIFYYIVKEKSLPSSKIVQGPPADLKAHAAKFRKRHPSCYVKDSRLFAKEKRKYATPEALVGSIIKGYLVKPYVSHVKIENFK